MQFIMTFLKAFLDMFVAMAPYLALGLLFAGILHVIVRKDMIARHLGKKGFASVVKASILGVPLPLCSCGVVPTAMALRTGGASEGATVAFLITTPETGVDSITATWGMLGPVFGIFRPINAFISGILGGFIADATGKAEPLPPAHPVFSCPLCDNTTPHRHGIVDTVKGVFHYGFGVMLGDIAVNLLIGLLLAAAIALYVPPHFFDRFSGTPLLEMLVAAAVGIPMYVCATGSIPIAAALMMTGFSPGAAFVFLATGPATNAASMLLISRVMGWRIFGVYLSSIIAAALFSGTLLNMAYRHLGGFSAALLPCHVDAMSADPLMIAVSALFALPFLYALSQRLLPQREKTSSCSCEGGATCSSSPAGPAETSFPIQGMRCSHCVETVTGAIRAIDGVASVAVSLNPGMARVGGIFDAETVKNAITGAGYRVDRP